MIKGKKIKITQKQVIKALEDSKGILSNAAKSLGVSRNYIYRMMDKFPKIKEARDNAEEAALDYVESKLFELIDNLEKTAIIFFLKTKGYKRAYVEKQVVETIETKNPIILIKPPEATK